MSLAAGTKLGPYEVLSPIGAGGMGEVYRARDSRLDRTVAIKVLHTAAIPSADALARFEREARSVSQLSHPHICPLFDVGEEGGIRFLVMPLLKGRIVWLDRAGKESGSIGDSTVTTAHARISPDGTRVVFDRTQPRTGTYDLWTYDIDRAVEQSVTSARMSEISGVWLRGANAIIYSGGVPPHLIKRDLTTGTEKVLLSSPGFDVAEDTSPDGKTVVFRRRTLRGTFDIWSATLGDSPSASPIVETPFDEASVRFSPDGRHIAFESDESGRYEVYIATFPNAAVKTRVSTAGGSLPRWSRDGDELFFVAADRHLMSVPVSPGVPIALGSAAPLCDIPAGSAGGDFNPNNGWTDFDPSPDGKRFLAVVPEPAGRKPVTVMMGWMPRTTGR